MTSNKSLTFIVKRWRGNEKSLQPASRIYFARLIDSGIHNRTVSTMAVGT